MRGTDGLGNTGPLASFSWSIDTTAPIVSITEAPTILSNSSYLTFTFGSEQGARFECSLDGAAFATCVSSKIYSAVAQGSHTFQVRATDGAGNASAPTSYTWTIDSIAPETTITSSPATMTNSTSASFAFSIGTGRECAVLAGRRCVCAL